MTVRIIATGDFHLGRIPSRLHPELSPLSFSVESVLERIVGYAVQNRVNYVVLTGDLVDSSNKMFEGYSALERFVGELIGSGIEVIAVAGNHDHDVLPRIKRQIPDLRLLSNGEEWTEIVFAKNGELPIKFQGRSFTTASQQTNQLQNYPSKSSDIFTVGVLHCDPDTDNSVYGSVAIKELDLAGANLWLLGHIHKPKICRGSSTVIVCGCPQGLDPGESGFRGPWLVDIEPNRNISARQLPMALLSYERIEVNLSQIEAVSDIREHILQAFLLWETAHSPTLGEVKAVGVRLYFVGATSLFTQLPKVIQEIENDSPITIKERIYFIEKIINAATPAINIKNLTSQRDLIGLYAQKLLTFLEESSQQEILQAKRQLRSRLGGMPIAVENSLSSGTSLTDDQLEAMLKQAGEVVLAKLLEQKSGGGRQ